MIVAVSAISYGSYLLQTWTKGRGGVLLSALLGGAYSSTLTTVVPAKRAREQSLPHLYAGSTLVASGVMYLRLLALLSIFNRQLLHRLGLPFLLLAATALFGGWTRGSDHGGAKAGQTLRPKNPLELGAAFLFAGLFVGMLLITHRALLHLGRAALLAAGAIVITAASNNLSKGIYAYVFADRRTGTQGLALLTFLALVGLMPLFL